MLNKPPVIIPLLSLCSWFEYECCEIVFSSYWKVCKIQLRPFHSTASKCAFMNNYFFEFNCLINCIAFFYWDDLLNLNERKYSDPKFWAHDCVILVQSTKIGTNKNKAIHSMCYPKCVQNIKLHLLHMKITFCFRRAVCSKRFRGHRGHWRQCHPGVVSPWINRWCWDHWISRGEARIWSSALDARKACGTWCNLVHSR